MSRWPSSAALPAGSHGDPGGGPLDLVRAIARRRGLPGVVSRPGGAQRLLDAARVLDGEPLALGDVAARIPALPRVPIAYALWRGDEEFPPGASVVFDASVEGYLDAEVVTVLAELVTRRLVAAAAPDA